MRHGEGALLWGVNLIVLSIPIFFGLIALEVIWDQWKGLRLYRLGDTLANIGCGIMDQSSGLFAKALTVGAYAAVFHFTESWRTWDFSTGIIVWMGAFVLTDLAYYWAHRTSHEVNLFWIGHSVHHQSEDYNLGVALRQSVLQKVLMMWVYWPLAALGFPPEMFLTSMAINLLYQFWIHTELIDRMGPLEWVLNTPSHHRVHHGRNPEYIDRNHAGVLIIWDRMFGTFQKEMVKPTYGVTRPTDTFNPVHAQWKPVADLWRDLRAIPGWRDKLRFLFAAPGWYPDSVGGPQPAPDITGGNQVSPPAHPTCRAVALVPLRRGAGWRAARAERGSEPFRHRVGGPAGLGLRGVGRYRRTLEPRMGKGRWLLSLAVDLSLVPAWMLCPGVKDAAGYPLLALAAASAAWTWWALSASRRR